MSYIHIYTHSPSSLSLSLWEKCSSLLILWPFVGLSCLSKGAQNWTRHSSVASPVVSRGEGSSSFLLPVLCLMQPRVSLATFMARSHYWFMFDVVSTRSPGPFSAELLPLVSPQGTQAFFSLDEGLPIPLLNCLSFLSVQFSRLSRNLWMAAQPSQAPAILPSYTPPAALLRIPSAPSPRSSGKMLNRAGPRTEPRVHHYLLASSWTSCC